MYRRKQLTNTAIKMENTA